MDNLKISQPDGWTLFLDRDGVINERPINDYVKTVAEFHFLPKVKESLALLSNIFNYIILITNQQGIGKGLMKMEDLNSIHDFMVSEINNNGGRIDSIYVAPQLRSEKSIMRKPGIGMGLMAKKDYPDIDFSKSIMVGDALTDMLFAKRLKMKSIFIGNDKDILIQNSSIIDYRFDSLFNFAKYIIQ